MARILTLPETASALDAAAPGWETRQTDWRDATGLEARVNGIMRQASAIMRRQGAGAAMDFIRAAARELGLMPLVLIANIIQLARQLRREPEAAADCLEFGRQACAQGYDDLALEACAAGMMLDTQSDYAITNSPAQSRALADLYEAIAQRMASGLPQPAATHPSSPLRAGLVVSNLVDHVVAYTKTALHFARHHDRARFTLKLYSTENLAQREQRLFPFGADKYRSEQTGAETMAACRKLGVPVFLTPRNLAFTAAARALIRQTAADGMDILIFQSGLACPIDWLTARLAPAPVKLAIHIGSFLFNPGLTATFYDNPVNITREQEHATPAMGRRLVLRQGTDLEELARQPALRRADFGIPADAVVLGVMSNHLARRLTAPYMGIISDILACNPNAWFVIFGDNPPADKIEFFKKRGVAGRVVVAGPQTQAGAALKMLDIYVNEFPVGGSQSVIEAMACGVPAAAMHWSDLHAECAGAMAVGPDFAVPAADPPAYQNLIQTWIDGPAARAAAGRALRQRAASEYSVAQYTANLLSFAASSTIKKNKL